MRYGNFDIRHGDRVVARVPSGLRLVNGRALADSVIVRGKAVGLLMFPGHLVLNCGGAHGTPRVVYPDQIVSVKSSAKESA